MPVRSNADKIAVLDFGGQYAHLIANRIRRLGVFSEIVRPDAGTRSFAGFCGIIFSGGPHSVYEAGRPDFNEAILRLDKPVLGICYGHQLISQALGGEVRPGRTREFGQSVLHRVRDSRIFRGLEKSETVWMSHGDSVHRLPEGFRVIGSTKDCAGAAIEDPVRRIVGFQFHPEVTHTPSGMKMLDNFLSLCGARRTWDMKRYLSRITSAIRKKAGRRNVFLLVSGGVDSTVAFALLNRVLGEKRVLGLHIDNGFMRLDETKEISAFLKRRGFHNMVVADASEFFLKRVKGVSDPEQKRRIIGQAFIDVQRAELTKLGLDSEHWMLGQGTIYPDTIESGGTKHAALIKTHHNRVPVIAKMIREGGVIEPLADLYKDEVRELGRRLGLEEALVWRHPFPGPGLSVRALCNSGEKRRLPVKDLRAAQRIAGHFKYRLTELPLKSVGVQGDFRTYAAPVVIRGGRDWRRIAGVSTELTNNIRALNRVVLLAGARAGGRSVLHRAALTRPRLDLLRRADALCTSFLKSGGFYSRIWQMPVVLVPVGSRSHPESLVLRPVCSSEAMTADFFRMPFSALDALAGKLLRLDGICAVYYDVTNKPPATIEWE